MRKISGKMDMLSGSLADKILLFAIPLAASSILQQLFNSVDVAVVGHFASDPALATAAVGCNAPIINLVINLFVGVSVGANVVVSSFIGAGRRDEVNRTVHSAMALAIVCGLLLLVIGVSIAEPALSALDTPQEVLPQAVLYLRIYSIGMPFIMIYNFGAAVLRCVGDTRRPLICLTISGALNAVLNIVFVIAFGLDVEGVAIATVISNVLSAVMVWIFLMRERSEIRIELGKLRIAKDDLSRILRVGIPAGLQSMVFSLSNIFIQAVLNSFGMNAMAGSAAALNYENFSYFVVSSFTQAAVTFTSQNYGAKEYGRCRKVFRICMAMGLSFTALVSLTFVAGHDFFASIFINDPAVLEYAVKRIVYVLPLYLLIVTYEVGGASLRGIGYSMTPAVITILGMCVFRMFWSYVICGMLYPYYEVLMIVYPVSWFLTGSCMLVAYFILRRRAFAR